VEEYTDHTGRRVVQVAYNLMLDLSINSFQMWLKNDDDFVFEHIELPEKLPDYFLQSDKSKINQSIKGCITHVLSRWVIHSTI